jgi:hypothetical protein
VPGGPSARHLFNPVLCVFVVFLLAFVFDPILFRFLLEPVLRTVRASVADGPDPVRTVHLVLADSPFFPFVPGGSVGFYGLSTAPGRTVRVVLTDCRDTWPDCPRGQCGQSAPPGRTVRQCLAALLLGSIPLSFLSCFRVSFKESFLRLEVDP